MQHNDERPPTSGRPSLLSPEQTAGPGGPRILGGLAEDRPGDGISAGSGGRSKYSLLAAGVIAMAVIGGGAALLLDGEGEKQIVLASTEALPAAAAKAAPLATVPAIAPAPAPTPANVLPVNPEADQVSTAAILQESPPVAEKKSTPADELTTLLEHRDTATQTKPASTLVLEKSPAVAPVVVKHAAKPAVKKVVVAKAAAHQPGVKPAQRADAPHTLAAAPARKKNELHPKASQSMDSDVTLLAALVAHSKATQPKKASSAAERLRQCKALGSVEEAEQCRARMCATGSKEAQCKPARLAKEATES